jgi:hypothetical protein
MYGRERLDGLLRRLIGNDVHQLLLGLRELPGRLRLHLRLPGYESRGELELTCRSRRARGPAGNAVGMSAFRRLLRVTVALGALAATNVAYAAPTAADRETARTLMEQGRDLRDAGNLKDALQRFQAAHDIMHVPTTALEVAKAEVALGLLVEARDTVAALRQVPADQDSALFKAARGKAEELDSSLSGRVPAVTITINGATPGLDLELALDGVAVPARVVGLPRSVNPGHHVITAKSSTGGSRQEVDIREGEQKAVELEWVASVAAPPPVSEASDTPAEPAQEPSPKKHTPTALTFVGIAIAGAGVIAGSVTGLVSLSKKSTLSTECLSQVCGPSSYSTLDSADLFATASDVSFAIAGAGAAMAVVTLVVGHRPAPAPLSSSAWAVTPWITGSAAGLKGSF